MNISYFTLFIVCFLWVLHIVWDVHAQTDQCMGASEFDAMETLLGSRDDILTFFESHFEHAHMFIPHSTRPNRKVWIHHYRRFLPNGDLDLLLIHNVSITSEGNIIPLQLQKDVDVQRVALIDGINIWKPISISPHLHRIRSAVRDGAILRVYHMSSRSRRVSIFEDGLRTFWTVSVSTSFLFHPPQTVTHPFPAPIIDANDIFLVSLHGDSSIHLYHDYFPSPSLHHVDSIAIHQAAQEHLPSPKIIHMDEGDVLYIPRGMAVDIRTTESMALFISFEIHTHERQVVDGISYAVNITSRTSNLLQHTATDASSDMTSPSPTWHDVILTAIRMAAEFTPEMRRFLPTNGILKDIMLETGSISTQLIVDAIGRFSRAAGSALFDPVVEILVDEKEGIEGIASDEVVQWAKDILKQGKQLRYRMKNVFHACIEEVAHSTGVSEDVMLGLSAEWNEIEKSPQRREFLKRREIFLAKHNQSYFAEDEFC